MAMSAGWRQGRSASAAPFTILSNCYIRYFIQLLHPLLHPPLRPTSLTVPSAAKHKKCLYMYASIDNFPSRHLHTTWNNQLLAAPRNSRMGGAAAVLSATEEVYSCCADRRWHAAILGCRHGARLCALCHAMHCAMWWHPPAVPLCMFNQYQFNQFQTLQGANNLHQFASCCSMGNIRVAPIIRVLINMVLEQNANT